jgi:hypothetical protein
MLTNMERPKWVFWQDQGRWCGHPEGNPDGEIHAASFDELQVKVRQLSQTVAKSPREFPRIERHKPRIPDLDSPRYVLSQDQGKWRGHLHGYPDYAAQGESFDEVQFKLVQLCRDLMTGKPSTIRKVA